jgi:hypothetical protein
VNVVVDVNMGIAIVTEDLLLIDSYHGAVVGAGLTGDDKLTTSSPVITSIRLT